MDVDRLIERGKILHARVTFHLDQADAASQALQWLLNDREPRHPSGDRQRGSQAI